MSYAFVHGPCCVCKQPMSYHPHRVPSIRIDGEREPVCQNCVAIANPRRIAKGLKPFVVHANAYQPCHESEL